MNLSFFLIHIGLRINCKLGSLGCDSNLGLISLDFNGIQIFKVSIKWTVWETYDFHALIIPVYFLMCGTEESVWNIHIYHFASGGFSVHWAAWV